MVTNKEDMSYMIEDTTPVKACVDISCNVSDGGIYSEFTYFCALDTVSFLTSMNMFQIIR